MVNKAPRVFIGLCEIVGFNNNLTLGFDELGVDSVFAELNSHPFKYGERNLDNFWIRIIRFFGDKRSGTPRQDRVRKIFWIFCQQTAIIPLFIWALIKFDVFIFSFGESFFRLLDLPILKLCGKRIICVFFGSESRPPYLNGKYSGLSPEECFRLTKEFKHRVNRIEQYADIIINHPPTAHFHEKPFVQFMAIGLPLACNSTKSSIMDAHEGTVRILHAPSYSACKGTDRIRAAIANIKSRGYAIEFIEVINQPNAVVITELQQCDFVVDELFSDAVMAGFATEAAFCGKPAIVAGYASERDWGNIPTEDLPPVHYCHPDCIEEAIVQLVTDREYRQRLGERAHAYVTEQWTPKIVAERFLKLIQNDVPQEWYYDPQSIAYLHGWGQREEQLRCHLDNLIRTHGPEALQISDKPILLKRFLDFAAMERV